MVKTYRPDLNFFQFLDILQVVSFYLELNKFNNKCRDFFTVCL